MSNFRPVELGAEFLIKFFLRSLCKTTNLGVFGSDDGPEFGDGDRSLVFGTAFVVLNDGFLVVRVARDDPFELILVREVVPEINQHHVVRLK